MIAALNLLSDVDEAQVIIGSEDSNPLEIAKGEFSEYVKGPTGGLVISAFAKGEVDTLASTDIEMKSSESYSVFLVGNKEKSSILLSTDDLRSPQEDKVKIRFANLTETEHGDFDLWIGDSETPSIEKIAPKEIGNFLELETQEEGTTIKLTKNGETDVLASLEKAELKNGKIYTVYAEPEKDGAAQNLVLSILTNK